MTPTHPAPRRGLLQRFPQPSASKVPEITLGFWVAKIVSTGLGEATSDALVHRLGGPEAVLIGFVAFCVAMVVQFATRRYVVAAYWFAVGMVGVFGTMAADVLHVGFGIPYTVSASLYLIVLAVLFATWRIAEGTVSIHSITTTRREIFYWLAVTATFAMGTALGDLMATTAHLGFASSTVLFLGLFVVPGVVFFFWRAHGVLLFWAAYVLTRPLGASFADYLGMPAHRSGVGIGAATVAGWSWGIYVVVVGVLIVVARRGTRRLT